MRLYDHPASGNCMKARILLRQLEIPYESVPVDLFRRETRTPEHMARNPDGRVPVLELDTGQMIPESGAILLYLAEGTPLLPDDRLARAAVHQWMFFEQNQIESSIAVARATRSSGSRSVPSERKSRIAPDSAIIWPESSSSTGTRPSGLRAMCSGVRVSRRNRSTVTAS